MAGALKHTEDWRLLPWQEIERNVFRLQQRVYTCTCTGASVKPQAVATSSVSTIYNVFS